MKHGTEGRNRAVKILIFANHNKEKLLKAIHHQKPSVCCYSRLNVLDFPPLRSATLWLNNNKDDIAGAVAAARTVNVLSCKLSNNKSTTPLNIFGGLRSSVERNKYFQYLPALARLGSPDSKRCVTSGV